MELIDVMNYLTQKKIWKKVVSYEPITLGASGAKLYTVNDGTKKYVLKVAHESFHCNKEQLKSYWKEFNFYQWNRELHLPYVPEIVYAEAHPEYGILLVMECYEAISHGQWDLELQKRAVDLCAKLNGMPLEKLKPLGLNWNPTQIEEDFTRNSYRMWVEVLEEHEGRFNRKLLDTIYKNLGAVCPVLNSSPQYVCHGDFHPENVLTDGKQLYLCDWQGINIGKCVGDISFFFSRGIGFGIPMDEEVLLSYYCERLSEYKSMSIDPETLKKERSASNLLTTFSFWANYLKNASYESVYGHFHGMEEAAKLLNII